MLLVDSDVLIDYLKGREPETTLLKRLASEGQRLGTTCITAGEVWRRAVRARTKEEREAVRHALDSLPQLPFGPRAAARFGHLMADLDTAGTPIATADGMIAAIALEASSPLLTRNVRHFKRIEGLVVRAPEDPTQT